MSLLVVALGAGLLALPRVVVATDLRPETKVRVGCTTIAIGMVVTAIGLALSASPLTALVVVENRTHRESATHLAPGGLWVWSIAAAAIAAGLSVIINTTWLTQSERRRAGFPRWAAASTTSVHGVEVRVAPSTLRVAYAVPGPDRHIVITEAVRDGLSPSQLQAVVAHESAHLVLSHQRHLFLLALHRRVCGWIPGAGHTVEGLRLAIEQWADSVAVAEFGADPQALPAAFKFFPSPDLSTHPIGARISQIGRARASSPGDLAVVVSMVVVLVGAALYGASHSVAEFATVLALR